MQKNEKNDDQKMIIAKEAAKEALQEFNLSNNKKLYYVNQVSKILGVSFRTVKKKCEAGYIKTTKDGMITGAALNEYLNQ